MSDDQMRKEFEAFLKEEAPAIYDASNADARYIWTKAWQAALATQPQAPQEGLGGWIRWPGGECPIAKDVLTEVRLRGEGVSNEIRPAGQWFWNHDLGESDIVAYRTAPTETPEDQQ